MHDTALAIGRKFFELYGGSPGQLVVEIGSKDVNGTLRAVPPEGAAYLGRDISPGKNVDVVCMGRQIPLPDSTADLTVASSVLEHDPLFWRTFLEICRITKPGGFVYLNVPSNGKVHRHPQDCWRFYPDPGAALATWARSEGIEATCVESFTAERMNDVWNDFVAVFARAGPTRASPHAAFLSDHFPARNISRFEAPETIRPTAPTEDVRLLAQAIRALLFLESAAAEIVLAAEDEARPDLQPQGHVRRLKRLVGGDADPELLGAGGPDAPLGDVGPFDQSVR